MQLALDLPVAPRKKDCGGDHVVIAAETGGENPKFAPSHIGQRRIDRVRVPFRENPRECAGKSAGASQRRECGVQRQTLIGVTEAPDRSRVPLPMCTTQ